MTKNDMCGFQKQGQKANYVYEKELKSIFSNVKICKDGEKKVINFEE